MKSISSTLCSKVLYTKYLFCRFESSSSASKSQVDQIIWLSQRQLITNEREILRGCWTVVSIELKGRTIKLILRMNMYVLSAYLPRRSKAFNRLNAKIWIFVKLKKKRHQQQSNSTVLKPFYKPSIL